MVGCLRTLGTILIYILLSASSTFQGQGFGETLAWLTFLRSLSPASACRLLRQRQHSPWWLWMWMLGWWLGNYSYYSLEGYFFVRELSIGGINFRFVLLLLLLLHSAHLVFFCLSFLGSGTGSGGGGSSSGTSLIAVAALALVRFGGDAAPSSSPLRRCACRNKNLHITARCWACYEKIKQPPFRFYYKCYYLYNNNANQLFHDVPCLRIRCNLFLPRVPAIKGSYFSEGRCLVPRLDLWVLCWVGAVFSTLLVAVREVLDGTVRSLRPALGSVREVLGAVLDLMVLFFGATISSLCCGCIFGCCETVREVVGGRVPSGRCLVTLHLNAFHLHVQPWANIHSSPPKRKRNTSTPLFFTDWDCIGCSGGIPMQCTVGLKFWVKETSQGKRKYEKIR